MCTHNFELYVGHVVSVFWLCHPHPHNLMCSDPFHSTAAAFVGVCPRILVPLILWNLYSHWDLLFPNTLLLTLTVALFNFSPWVLPPWVLLQNWGCTFTRILSLPLLCLQNLPHFGDIMLKKILLLWFSRTNILLWVSYREFRTVWLH